MDKDDEILTLQIESADLPKIAKRSELELNNNTAYLDRLINTFDLKLLSDTVSISELSSPTENGSYYRVDFVPRGLSSLESGSKLDNIEISIDYLDQATDLWQILTFDSNRQTDSADHLRYINTFFDVRKIELPKKLKEVASLAAKTDRVAFGITHLIDGGDINPALKFIVEMGSRITGKRVLFHRNHADAIKALYTQMPHTAYFSK